MTRSRINPSASTSIAAAIFVAALSSSADAAIKISANATKHVACSEGVCQATASTAMLNVSDLVNMLEAGDVTVVSGSIAHDIEINAALRWTSTSHLTLDSYYAITINSPVIVAGAGSLTITTNDGAHNGDYRFLNKGRIEFRDLNSGLTINGENYVLENRIHDLARDIRQNTRGNYALAKSINTRPHVYSASPIPFLLGKFDGLGNSIANLTIDAGASPKVGLFAQISGQAVVRDIGLTDVNITGAAGEKGIGALVGYLTSASVKYAYATGQVSGTGTAPVGGLIGQVSFGVISGSYANVSVDGGDSSTAAGGLIGFFDGATNQLIGNSYATGAVSAGANASVGGLVGINTGEISNAYAMGAVSGGDGAKVGGLIGQNTDGELSKPFLSDDYAIGAVSGGSGATTGGLIGEDVADAQASDTYWDLDTSGISDPHRGAGNVVDDEGITGLTTAQFKAGLPSGLSPLNWAEKATRNGGYPYLIANPPPK